MLTLSTTTAGLKTVQLPQAVIDSRRQAINSSTKVLSYPRNLGNHFMLFQFKEYNRFKANVKDSTSIQASVALPIPTGLREDHHMDFTQAKMGILGAIAEDPGIQAGVKAIWDHPTSLDSYSKMSGTWARLLNSKNDIINGILRQAVQQTGALGVAVDQMVGEIPNPHLVTAFQGVTLRVHNFSWLFAPESADDSLTLQNIVRTIRHYALPPYRANKILLEYPSEVDISVGGVTSDFKYVFKTAVVDAVRYDRSPYSVQTHFKGTGAPVISRLDMVLREVEIFSREDIEIGK